MFLLGFLCMRRDVSGKADYAFVQHTFSLHAQRLFGDIKPHCFT